MSVQRSKYIVALLAIVTMLLVAIPIYWYQTVTATADIENVVASQLTSQLGRHVAVGAVRISPTGAIIVKNVQIDDSGEKLLEAKEVVIRYNILHLFRQNPLSGLSSITFQQPEIYVNRNASTQEWNIIRFLKDLKKPNQSSTLNTKFRLADAKIFIKDNKRDITFEQVTGAFDFDGTPNLSLQIAALFEGRSVGVKGFYNTAKESYGLEINGEIARIETLADCFSLPEVVVDKGGMQASISLLQEQYQPLQYSGEIVLTDASLKSLKTGYVLSEITGKVFFNNKEVFINESSANLNGEPVAITGSVALDGRQPYWDLTLQSTNISVQKALPGKKVPIEGKMQANLHVVGVLDDLSVQGTLGMAKGIVSGIPIENGQVSLSYHADWIDLHSIKAKVYGGQVEGQGVVKLAGIPVYNVLLQLDGVQSPYPAMTGAVTASVYATGRADELTTMWGAGRMEKGIVQGVPYDVIDTGFYWSNGQLQLDYCKLALEGGWVQVTGKGSKQQLDLDLQGYKLPLGRFASVMGNISINGLGNIKGKVQGTWEVPVLSGTFETFDGTIYHQSFAHAVGRFTLTKEKISLEDVVFTYKSTVHNLSGSILFKQEPVLDFTIISHNAPADEVIRLLAPDKSLRGRISNNIRIRGPISNLEIQGQAVLTQGEFNGQRIDYAKARYTHHNGLWHIEDGLVAVGRATLEIAGTINQQRGLDLKFAAKNILLEEHNIKQLPYKIGGRAEFAGTITGTQDNPHINSSIQAYSAVINGQRFGDLLGRIELLNNQLFVPELKLTEQKACYFFSGRIDFNNPALVEGTLTVREGQIQQLLGLLGYPISNAQGNVNADLILSGPLAQPDAKGSLVVTQGNIKGYAVEKITLDVVAAKGLITVNTLELQQGQGFMRAQGTLAMNGVLAMEVGGKNLDAGFVAALLPTSQPVKGLINFAAQIGGTAQNPQVAVSIEIKQGSWQNATFDSLYALAQLDNDRIKLNQIMLVKGPYKASAYGTVPLAALTANGRAEPKSSASMDIQMRLEQADLSILPLLSRSVAWAVGPTQGDLRIEGTLAQPYIYGKFTVKDGTVKLAALNNSIEHANIDLEFAGDKMRLNTFNGKLGTGTYTGSGEAVLNGFSLTNLNFNINFDKLYVNSKYYIGPVQGALALTSVNQAPVLKGNLLLENATMSPPVVWPSGDDLLPNVQLDLEIQADKNVRLRNARLYDMYIQGRIKAQGSTHHPITSGRVAVTRGTLQYLSTSFKIVEGVADFNQYESFLPSVRVTAETRALDTKVKLYVTGPVSQMDFRLTSEPSLSQQQIITLLTLRSRSETGGTGTGVTDRSGRDQLSLLLNEGLQLTFVQRIERVVENFTGLDEFHIVRDQNSAVTDKEVYNLEVGKFITDKLFVGYTVGIDKTEQNYRFRYDFAKHLAFDGEMDSKHNRRLGIEARFSF